MGLCMYIWAYDMGLDMIYVFQFLFGNRLVVRDERVVCYIMCDV